MPRLTESHPKYRRHRASGQAVVTLSGKDHYLGPFGSKANKADYDRLIGEWLAAGRKSSPTQARARFTITEVVAAYWQFAQGYYVKDGKASGGVDGIKVALRLLR